MRDDVRDAIDKARQPLGGDRCYVHVARGAAPRRSFEATRAELVRLLRDMPEDLTVCELRQELEDLDGHQATEELE